MLQQAYSYPAASEDNYSESYIYNSKGLISEVKKQPLDFEVFSTKTFFYDNNDQLIREEKVNELQFSRTMIDGKGIIKLEQDTSNIKVIEKTYDITGNFIREIQLIINDSTEIEQTCEKIYDEKNRLVELKNNWFTKRIRFIFYPHEKRLYTPSGLIHRRQVLNRDGSIAFTFESFYTFY